MIDWHSPQNEILMNPRMPQGTKEELQSALSQLANLTGHLCFATSGTSGRLKWVALSKQAILLSAKAVNVHLNSNETDIWLNPLPGFHVGGVGIAARGYLSGANVIDCHFPEGKWSPLHFHKQLQQSQATLTSMVPTQVFDLVSHGLEAPKSLRAIIVGGGAMSEHLYFAAVKLGWKLLPSYGLTECASGVATAELGSWNLLQYPLLKPLEHVELALDQDGFLKIKSESLLTAYVEKGDEGYILRDPKNDGWLTTEDKVLFEQQGIKSVSRGEHFVKIGGESVDLLRLDKILEEEKLALKFKDDLALVAVEDDRLGHRLHLAAACEVNEHLQSLMERYHQRVHPFERISFIHRVNKIPRSPLNKILKSELAVIIKAS